MEIVFKNVSYRYKTKKLLDHIHIHIASNRITGITGESKSLLCEMMAGILAPTTGFITVGNFHLEKDTQKMIQKEICLIRQNPFDQFFTNQVREEMLFLLSRLGYKRKDVDKKMVQALQMVGLDKTYLNRNISSLSTGEAKLVQIAVGLMSNPNVIIFDEVFAELDYRHRKNLIRLIRQLKEQQQKTIIITSNDSNLLYEQTDDIIILKRGKVITIADTVITYQNINLLLKEEIDIPNLIKFTALAREKTVKLSYHRDILDLIKDVYKHV